MAEPQAPAESEAVLERAIDVVLGKEGGSGYRDVYKGASKVKPWQAKPYIRPKVQRNLGSFPTPEEAAKAVIIWMFGGRPTPPTPTKERNTTSAALGASLAIAATKDVTSQKR